MEGKRAIIQLAGEPQGRGRAWSSTGCTTGASPASGTGVRRSRSSTARRAGRCRCRRRISRSCCRIFEDFRPDDTGVSPLARHEEWYYVQCPQCGRRGRRETDVSDTFLDSAWYYLRYPSTEFARPALRPRAHPQVAAGDDLYRRQRARRAAPALRPLPGHGPARPGAPALRGAVRPVSRPRAHHQGRREDVQVAGQCGDSGRLHRQVGRRHLPHVPDVPGPLSGGGRLPRRRGSAGRGAFSTRSGDWWGRPPSALPAKRSSGGYR